MPRTVFPPRGNLNYQPVFNLRIRPEGAYFRAEVVAKGEYRELPIDMSLHDVEGLCDELRTAVQDVAQSCDNLKLEPAELKQKLRPLADRTHGFSFLFATSCTVGGAYIQ